MDDYRRLFWAKRVILIGIISCAALCLPLWLNSRSLPLIPLLEGMLVLRTPFDQILLGLTTLAGLLAIVWPKKSWPGLLFLAGVMGLMIQDWNRMQPWMFHFVMLLVILQSLPGKYKHYLPAKPVLAAVQLGVIGLYFWSGWYKLNDGYSEKIVPYVVYPIYNQWWMAHPFIHRIVFRMALLAPYLEMATAIALLIPRTRTVAVLLGTTLHLGILYLLGPLGHNTNAVIWPWNIVLIPLLFLLFFKQKDFGLNRHLFRIQWVGLIALAFVLVIPALNMTGRYNKSLSFELYSGTNYTRHLQFHKSDVKHLPNHLENLSYNFKDSVYIRTYEWALRDIKTPPNPDPKVTDQWQRQLIPLFRAEQE
ncbi:hypothetical protein KFE98_18800 [bacterium SCSIO 12741]|nr:hypothetical protein KFE98_18800 [bacterium SCSIO 12741]